MADVLGTLAFFGSILAILVSFFRYRYRVKLLAAAMQHPGFLHAAQGSGAMGAEVEARVEALEEKLAWFQRLVESGEGTARLPQRSSGGAITIGTGRDA
jgi:hypothetical protein